MKKPCSIFWFKRDLRVEDNIGLHYALKSGLPVVPIFIFDKVTLEKVKDKMDMKIQFIHNVLVELKKTLKAYKSDLLILFGTQDQVWKRVLEDYNVKSVYTNEEYEPSTIKRDNQVRSFLRKKDIEMLSFKDYCIFAKDDILKKDGTPYTVFTPYKNKWYEHLKQDDLKSVRNRDYFKHFLPLKNLSMPSLKNLGFEECPVPNPACSLNKDIVKNYKEDPSLNITSQVSLHLRFGTISIRKCAKIGYEINNKWLDELIWRDFFIQILYHFPYAEKGPFKKKYSNIEWSNNKSHFKKWCVGQTGYPLVDAGMRELNLTGFMHNRVRMVVASFLVKHLLIDWRWGEKYFSQKLIDYDLSANNGNWQWVAGTGCDASPYFRIFNPETQMKKFDANLNYIKKWVPELGTSQYMERIVDHKSAYHKALSIYKKALGY
ncbi:DNA photolyase family protein [Bacteriovoracales bacterium]|nr:DNA photolyase family protein [Bacteriovoracales bacterium]